MPTSDYTVTLILSSDEGQTEEMSLPVGVHVIGRAPDCHVRVPAGFNTVSRRHARVTVKEGEVSIEDLGSRAGVVVNGEIVTRQVLDDGDVVALGDLRARVQLPQKSGTVITPLTFESRDEEIENFAGALDEVSESTDRVFAEIAKRIVGQEEIIKCVWAAVLARGHCLMIGVPGLAKTLLVSTLAEALQLKFNRIQFTPDLMPADIIGSQILTKTPGGDMEFRFDQGPIFTQLLLADEINRTPPKTQSALLQAMQEREVTVSRNTYKLGPPFCVIATQNPIEQEGTYPLPEAQQDRFMFCLVLDYPERHQEVDVLTQTAQSSLARVDHVLTYEEILRFQKVVDRIAIAPEHIEYITDLVRCTRPGKEGSPEFVSEVVDWGAGPRAGQSIIKGAKAFAAMEGRPSISRQDIQRVVLPVLRHRIGCNYRARTQKLTPDDIIRRVVQEAR